MNPEDVPGPDCISARSLGVDEERFEVLDIHVG